MNRLGRHPPNLLRRIEHVIPVPVSGWVCLSARWGRAPAPARDDAAYCAKPSTRTGRGPKRSTARPPSSRNLPKATACYATASGNGSMFFVPARAMRTAVISQQAASPAPGGGWAVPVRITLDSPHDQGSYYLRVRTSGGLTLRNADPLWSATGGIGVRWARVADAEGRPIMSYHNVGGPMQTVLTFDRKPAPNEVRLELEAAPDGIAGYSPSTGLRDVGDEWVERHHDNQREDDGGAGAGAWLRDNSGLLIVPTGRDQLLPAGMLARI